MVKGVVFVGVMGVLVVLGQFLVIVVDLILGMFGKDVLGNVLSELGNLCELLVGDNVELGVDGIVVNVFGYVHVVDDCIMVILVIWVGLEETVCYYVVADVQW